MSTGLEDLWHAFWAKLYILNLCPFVKLSAFHRIGFLLLFRHLCKGGLLCHFSVSAVVLCCLGTGRLPSVLAEVKNGIQQLKLPLLLVISFTSFLGKTDLAKINK